jgi:hypothetical protein
MSSAWIPETTEQKKKKTPLTIEQIAQQNVQKAAGVMNPISDTGITAPEVGAPPGGASAPDGITQILGSNAPARYQPGNCGNGGGNNPGNYTGNNGHPPGGPGNNGNNGRTVTPPATTTPTNPEDISSADDPSARKYETRFVQRRDVIGEDNARTYATTLTEAQLRAILGDKAYDEYRYSNGSSPGRPTGGNGGHHGGGNEVAGPQPLANEEIVALLSGDDLDKILGSLTDEQISELFPDIDMTTVGDVRDYGWYDHNGEWHQTRDLTNIAEQLRRLREITGQLPGDLDLTDIQDTEAWDSLQALLDLLSDPNRTDEDLAAARADAEKRLGMDPGGLSDLLSQYQDQLDQGVAGQQGMTPEEKDLYDRETGLEIQRMQDDNARMLEALGAGGRSTKGFEAMISLGREVASTSGQRQIDFMTNDFLRKQVEYEALAKRQETLFSQSQISIDQYVSELRQNRTMAMQGYAMQLDLYLKENEQAIAVQQQEYQALAQQAALINISIAADLGVSAQMIQETLQMYQQWMSDYYVQLDQQSLAAEQQAQQTNWFAAILGGIGGLLAIFNPPAGAAVVGVAGVIGAT